MALVSFQDQYPYGKANYEDLILAAWWWVVGALEYTASELDMERGSI